MRISRRPASLTRAAAAGRTPQKVWIGMVMVGLVVALAVLAPFLTPYDPEAIDPVGRLATPGSAHWLGTDELGRDTLTRVLYAGRTDLPVAALAAFLPLVLGSLLGLLAGYFGGLLDIVIRGLADLVQAFPVYVLMIALVFALGPGVSSMLVAYTAIGWVVYARMVRAETMRNRSGDYVAAARLGGLSTGRVLLRHVFPNVSVQPMLYFFSDVVLAMIAFATLSFFGLGVEDRVPEWGAMISSGQGFIRTNWWLAIAPGVAIAFVGTGLSLIADGLDERGRR